MNTSASTRDRIGGWGIALLGGAVSCSIAATHIIWIPLAVMWFGGALLRRPGFRWCAKPLGAPSFGIGTVVCLSGLVAGTLRSSLRRLRSYSNWLVCFLVASVPADQRAAVRGLRWFLAGSLITAALGLMQCGIGMIQVDSGAFEQVPRMLRGWPPTVLGYLTTLHGRAIGTRSHPLTYAEGLLFAWGLLLALWLRRHGWCRFWAGMGSLLVGAALIWSKSRGPWFAAAAILGLAWTIERRRVPLWGLVVLLGILGGMSVHPQIRARIQTISDVQEGSHTIRSNLWRTGWRMWKDHPWLGVGPRNVSRFYWAYQPAPHVGETWGDVHDLYLQVLVEQGVMGLGIFVWFMWTLLAYLAKAYRKYREEAEHAPWFLGMFLGAVGCFLAGLTETTLGDSEILFTLAFVTGSAMALERCLSDDPRSG